MLSGFDRLDGKHLFGLHLFSSLLTILISVISSDLFKWLTHIFEAIALEINWLVFTGKSPKHFILK